MNNFTEVKIAILKPQLDKNNFTTRNNFTECPTTVLLSTSNSFWQTLRNEEPKNRSDMASYTSSTELKVNKHHDAISMGQHMFIYAESKRHVSYFTHISQEQDKRYHNLKHRYK
jgi:hypothetical protein